MKSKKYPIEIDGLEFFVDRTFSNEPAIYRSNSLQSQINPILGRHISDCKELNPDDIFIIIARPK